MTADWTITEADGSVCDRFFSESEAQAALDEGGYPEGCGVEYVPDPGML